MKLRGKYQVGPGMGPEDTTGLPVELPPVDVVVPSGFDGQNFDQSGSGFDDEAPENVADWHGEGEVPGSAPPTGTPGSVIGGATIVKPVPVSEGEIDFDVFLQQQHDVLLAFMEVSHKLTAMLDRDHPQLVRSAPSRRADIVQYAVPAAGQPSMRLLGEDPSRRGAQLILETAATTVRVGTDRSALDNGQGYLMTPLVPIRIETAGEVWVVQAAGGATVATVSGWIEREEPWQVPDFGSYLEHNPRARVLAHHRESGDGGQ